MERVSSGMARRIVLCSRKLRRTAKSIFPVIGLFGERSAANCILYPGVLGFVANRWNEDVLMILGTEMECYLFPEHFIWKIHRLWSGLQNRFGIECKGKAFF